jgi:hypothetical protein
VRVYLDTEFADWDDPDTDLISIALVSEDGDEFYAECTDFDRRTCTNFVEENVLPLLGAPGVLRLNEDALKQAVLDWLAQIPEPEIAVDYDGDWHLLARLLAPDTPANLTVINIYKNLDKAKLEAYYLLHNAPRHHALQDARANKIAAQL